MLLIRAIVRPEKKDEVLEELSSAGFNAATMVDVVGRGKQKGIKIGGMVYDEIPKILILVAIQDADKEKVIKTILKTAKTGNEGTFGDGKIFVSPIEEVYTISKGYSRTLGRTAMKEIMAVIRMRRTSATKKALIAAGVAGFTAVKVSGRGRLGHRSDANRRMQREASIDGRQ